MSADEILRVVPNNGGGKETRFNTAKLSELSVSERTNLARNLVEGNSGSHSATSKGTVATNGGAKSKG